MVALSNQSFRAALLFSAVGIFAAGSVAATPTLRIATWNVDADTDRNSDGFINTVDGTYNAAGITTAVQAIANYKLGGNTQPLDVLSLQELYYDPTVTLTAIVNDLNAVYGKGTYAYDTTVADKTTGNATGNGGSGLIYNTKTVSEVGNAVLIGTPSGSGESRAPIRYQLQATNGTAANNTFYIYDEHAKADSGSDNQLRRAYEADAVRANADQLLNTVPTAHVIFTGDFNLTSGSSEAAYQDLTAASGTTLSTNGNPSSNAAATVAGGAQAKDPIVGSFATSTTGQQKYYTESDVKLTARFDLQLVTSNVLPGSTADGLKLIANTEVAFGNSYYNAAGVLTSATAVNGDIATQANANATGISLTDLQNLDATTDHLAVVADYAIPEPGTLGLLVAAGLVLRRRAR